MALDKDKIYMAVPAYDTDKIVGVLEGSISVAAPSDIDVLLTGSDTQNTGFNDYCYFQGIFSYDNGVTWNDFGAMIPDISDPSFPVFQTVDGNCYSNANGDVVTTITNYYNFVTSSSVAVDALYKIALIAHNNQGEIEPLPTNEDIYFSSKYNYQKIYLQDEAPFNLTSGSGTSLPVLHNLGYVPNVRAFFRETSGSLRMLPISHYQIDVQLESGQVIFSLDEHLSLTSVNGQVEYRIYLDD